MKITFAAVVLWAVVLGCSAHRLKWGSCKKITGMAAFDPERFNGTWYVIQKLVTSSPCMMATFGVEQENVLTIQEQRTPIIGQLGPLDMTVTNVGQLVMDPTNKANMKLKWKGGITNLIDSKYGILDTDYDNYALDFECQDLTIFHRSSATFYSRTNTLTQDIIDKLEAQLTKYRVDLARMSPIDHSNCIPFENNDFNIQVDDSGLSLLGLINDEEIINLETIEQVGEYAKKNIPKVGNGGN